MKRSYQVIVVGAGPAGSTLAFELASRGIRILLLERAVFPRYKCCAGGLTVKAANLLRFNINTFVDDVISSMFVTFRGSSPFHRYSTVPIMYTVMRETFDYALAKKAQEAGVDILQGVEAHAIRVNDLDVEVSTTMGSFRSEFVVGADGARSQVRKSMDIKCSGYIVGLQTEVQVTKKELAKWKSRIGIDIGRIRGGYGWVFPKAKHLSIGIAAPVERAKGLKNIYYEYLDSLKLGQRTILRWTASQLPICIGQPIVSQPRAILIGDAAGLADPLSGEGLYNAILSAKLGGNSIERAMTNCDVTLNDYSDAIATKIVPQMKIAYIFSKVLSQLPKQLFGVLNKDERVWQTCSKMLRGEIDYVTIKNKVSNLGGLYSLVSRI